ncbi:uncharacterized protein EKO05_0000972 [Ascochyta rabiei]|uniref:uncharacterized protein n=1 Tax=Didymella rabiei TaxID=5454 RepID=UPI0021FC12D8|nr:uncharacterized protein EKO05_0000972 [Ascochyta rabiei]UPX10305.1 hypothetical protein EKO05_0000972 [Ascochyta rabiei]
MMKFTREETAAALDQLIPRPPFDNIWQMSEAELLSVQKVLCLHESYGSWAQSPRLYTLLHMLQCDQTVLDQLQRANITDFWLPIDEPTLVRFGVKIKIADFLRVQQFVLSDPIYMSNVVLLETSQVHRHLQSGEEHLLDMEHINDGASARVFRVKHKVSGKIFACKRAPRGIIRFQQDRLRLFVQELDILRRLNHRHIIRLVTSYTDMDTFALVLHPVADESLKSMLNRPLSVAELSILRQSFGCLISALVYLHEERQVRHKDIKPDNILLDRDRIYLCDFGISLDWSEIGEATTHGKPFQRTIGYCAPEVISWQSRNDASDIWSMGRVFCDMITVIRGCSLSEMLEHNGGGLYGIYENPEAMKTWLLELKDEDSCSADNLPLAWAQDMIATRPASRPTASTMAARMLAETPDPSLSHTYVAPCCRVHLKDLPSASSRRVIMPRCALSLSNVVTVIDQMHTSEKQFLSARRDVSSPRPNSPVKSPTQQIDPTPDSARLTNPPFTNDKLPLVQNHSPQKTTTANKEANKTVEKGLIKKSLWSDLYRTGDVVITLSDGDHSASVCISCSVVDADYLLLTSWSWAFDGKFYRRIQEIALLWPSNTNTVKISELGCYPLRLDESGLAEALPLRGRVFWSCRTKRCISYHPASEGAELHDMRLRYMVDVNTYYRLHPSNVESSNHIYLDIDLKQNNEPPNGIFALLYQRR